MGVYWLTRFLHLKRNVAYRGLNKAITFFKYVDGHGYICTSEVDTKVPFVALCDGQEIEEADLGILAPAKLRILFASPYCGNYNLFRKEFCQTICLPPWSEEEMRQFALESDYEVEWYKKFQVVGGIPRHVFFSTDSTEQLKAIVDSYLPLHIDQLKKIFSNVAACNYAATDGNRSPHILVHFLPSKDSGARFILKFASLRVEQMLKAQFDLKAFDLVKDILLISHPSLQSWRGRHIESLALQKLAVLKEIKTISLEDSTEKIFYSEGLLATLFVNISEIKQSGMYNPRAKNFAVIDSLLVNVEQKTIIYIQSTVAKNHPIKHNLMLEHVTTLSETFPGFSHSLVFVVPKDVFTSFKKQKYTLTSSDVEHVQQPEISIPLYKYEIDLEIGI